MARSKLVILQNTCKSWYNQELWAYSTKRRKNPFRYAYVYNGLPRLDMLYSCHACRRTDDSLARVISLLHKWLKATRSEKMIAQAPQVSGATVIAY